MFLCPTLGNAYLILVQDKEKKGVNMYIKEPEKLFFQVKR